MFEEALRFPVISRDSVGLLFATPTRDMEYLLEEALRFPMISRDSVGLLLATPILLME